METSDHGADGIFEHIVIGPKKALSFDEDRRQEVCLEAVEALQRPSVAVLVFCHTPLGAVIRVTQKVNRRRPGP